MIIRPYPHARVHCAVLCCAMHARTHAHGCARMRGRFSLRGPTVNASCDVLKTNCDNDYRMFDELPYVCVSFYFFTFPYCTPVHLVCLLHIRFTVDGVFTAHTWSIMQRRMLISSLCVFMNFGYVTRTHTNTHAHTHTHTHIDNAMDDDTGTANKTLRAKTRRCNARTTAHTWML